MLKLLAFLWSGCWHNWAATGETHDYFDDARGTDLPVYRKRLYRCERCGIMKAFRE